MQDGQHRLNLLGMYELTQPVGLATAMNLLTDEATIFLLVPTRYFTIYIFYGCNHWARTAYFADVMIACGTKTTVGAKDMLIFDVF